MHKTLNEKEVEGFTNTKSHEAIEDTDLAFFNSSYQRSDSALFFGGTICAFQGFGK